MPKVFKKVRDDAAMRLLDAICDMSEDVSRCSKSSK